MDTRKLTEILRATIDPNQRQQAEEQLSQVSFYFVIHMLAKLTMLPNNTVHLQPIEVIILSAIIIMSI